MDFEGEDDDLCRGDDQYQKIEDITRTYSKRSISCVIENSWVVRVRDPLAPKAMFPGQGSVFFIEKAHAAFALKEELKQGQILQ